MRTTKDIKETIECWISKNPNLSLFTFHTVGGNLYGIKNNENDLLTGVMPIRELEKFLLGMFNANIYLKKLGL